VSIKVLIIKILLFIIWLYKSIVLKLDNLVNKPNENYIFELENFIYLCYSFFEIIKMEENFFMSNFFYLIECLNTVKEILNYGSDGVNIYFIDVEILYDKYEKDHLIILKNEAIEFFLDWEN
jgi:hypothetical protein